MSRDTNVADSLDAVLPLTPAVLHILLALAGGRAHGYAVAQEVERVTGGRVRMGPGTLYGSLQRMVEAGLIQEVEPPSGAEGLHAERRRYYGIRPLGRRALREESGRMAEVVRLARARLGPQGTERA